MTPPRGCDQHGRHPEADPIADLDRFESESERFFVGLLVAVAVTGTIIVVCLLAMTLP